MNFYYYFRLLAISIALVNFSFCYGSLTKQQKRLLPHGLQTYYLIRLQALVDGVQHNWPLVSPSASIQFDLNGEKITLDLERNDGLIDSTFHHAYQINGRMRRRKGTSQPFCYYHGRLRQVGKEMVRTAIDSTRTSIPTI